MFWSIVGFEFFQQMKSRVIVGVFIAFAIIGWLLITQSPETFGGGNININAPYNTLIFMGISTLFGIFAAAASVANVVTRDFEIRSWETIFTKPISRPAYVFGRFLGALPATMIAVAGMVVGLVLGVIGPLAPEAGVGPFRPTDYLYGLLLIFIPNMFVFSALLFAASTLTRSSLISYIAATGLVIFYMVNSQIAQNPDLQFILAIFDPMGVFTLTELSEHWTPFQLNTQMLPLTGMFLVNRVFWVTAGIVIILFTCFKFSPQAKAQKKKVEKSKEEKAVQERIIRPRISPLINGGMIWNQLIKSTHLEVSNLVFRPSFFILLTLSITLSLASASFINPVFGTPYMPTTIILTNGLSASSVIILYIIATYYAAELVWRERQLKLDQIIGATPAPSVVFFLSKLFALWLAVFILLMLSIVTMVCYQLLRGMEHLELETYALRMLLYTAAPIYLLAVAAIFFQTISGNKYLGMLMTLLVVLASMAGNSLLDHPEFFVYGNYPGLGEWSEVSSNTFRVFEVMKYNVYWAFMAVTLGIITYLMWVRGVNEGLGARMKAAWRGAGLPLKGAIGASLLLFCGFGMVLYNEDVTNNKSVPRNPEVRDIGYDVAHEKAWGHLIGVKQPTIRKINAQIDTYVQDRMIKAKSSFILENHTDQPIELLHMNFLINTTVHDIHINNGSQETFDEDFNRYVFKFDQPLAPGEETVLYIDLTTDYTDYPIKEGRADAHNMQDGATQIPLTHFGPYIGFDVFSVEVDPEERATAGLPPLAAETKLEDADIGREYAAWTMAGYSEIDITISVDEGYEITAGGQRVREWDEGGRHYVKFGSTERNISNAYVFHYGRWEKKTTRHNGVDLAVYYNHKHDDHIDTFLEGMKISMNYFTENFFPYPYPSLDLVQMSFGQGANASANQVTFGQHAGFTNDLSQNARTDWGTWVVGHEIGHEWWGVMLTAANVEGKQSIIESLAQYSAAMVTEKLYDRGMVGRFMRYSQDVYFQNRRNTEHAEVPLQRSINPTQYIHYWKGAPVLYGLKEMLGEDRFNLAIRNFANEWAFAMGPYPIILDLIGHIRAVAPAEYQHIISDYYERILIHDFTVPNADVQQLDDGQYLVRATIKAQKFEQIDNGQQLSVALNEPLHIVLVDDKIDEIDRYGAGLIHEERRWITEEETIVEIVVDQPPAAIIVDPYHNFIEREVDDNVKRLKK